MSTSLFFDWSGKLIETKRSLKWIESATDISVEMNWNGLNAIKSMINQQSYEIEITIEWTIVGAVSKLCVFMKNDKEWKTNEFRSMKEIHLYNWNEQEVWLNISSFHLNEIRAFESFISSEWRMLAHNYDLFT